MGLDPVTLTGIAATAVGAAGTVVGGVQESRAAKANAAQARVAAAEAEKQKKAQAAEFLARQTTAFRKSGVTLQGTPMQVLGSTAGKFAEERQQIKARGRAGVAAHKLQAKNALIGGVIGGASTLASGASFFNK